MSTRDASTVRAGIAIAAGCLAAMTAYAALRVFQALKGGEADPARVIFSEHAGYFWRSWTAGYVGGMVALLVWLLAARSPERAARILRTGLTIATLALLAQGVFIP